MKSIAVGLGRVQVSIDGFSEKSNSRIRGKGCFEKSLRAVDYFARAGVKVEVAVTPMLTDTLESESPQYVAWAKELRRKYQGYDVEFRFTGELKDGRDVSLTPKEQKRYGQIMTSIHRGYFGQDVEAESFIAFVKAHEKKCGCALGSFNVRANGDVYVCGQVSGMMPVANVRRDDYQETFHNLRKLTRLSHVDNLSPCKDCALRYFCGGGCRIVYFNAFAVLNDLRHLLEPHELRRECSLEYKEHYYQLMIETNERLFH